MRNPVEAARWRPEGAGIGGYANIPYYAFIDDEDAAVHQMPQGRSVFVLCAKGGSSDYVAGVLRERGIPAANIEGGMIAWAQHHRIVRVNPAGDMFGLYQVVRPAKGCLSYVLISGREALVVDGSRYDEVYRNFAQQHGAQITATLDTHLHADHVSGGAALARESGGIYHLADEDAAGAAIGHAAIPRRFTVGEVPVEVVALPVPGHTLGSTALLVAGRYLISGDTLLPEGIGRPDLGNKAREWTGYLYDSLTRVLARLDPHVTVLPAHASSSRHYDVRGSCVRTLGDLLAAQEIGEKPAFLERVESAVSQTAQPPEYAEIRGVNLGKNVSAERLEELEIGVNQCALAKE